MRESNVARVSRNGFQLATASNLHVRLAHMASTDDLPFPTTKEVAMFCKYTVKFLYGEGLQEEHEVSFESKKDAWCYTKAVLCRAAVKGVDLQIEVWQVTWGHEDSEHFYTLLFSRTLSCMDETID